MIETYYQEGKKTTEISKTLGRTRQIIYNVITFLKEGHSAYDYFERYKANKICYGHRKAQLSNTEKDLIQSHLALNWSLYVVKDTYPDKISCSMQTRDHLADRTIFINVRNS